MKQQGIRKTILLATSVMAIVGAPAAIADPAEMSFFVTSVGSGKGGDLGGIAGADAHCAALAKAAGAKQTNWRAYLTPGCRAGYRWAEPADEQPSV